MEFRVRMESVSNLITSKCGYKPLHCLNKFPRHKNNLYQLVLPFSQWTSNDDGE